MSKKAVLEGAGLIDLFFKDVENKKNDKEFLIMMEQKHGMKFFENIIGDVKQLGVYMASLFDKHPEDIIIQPPNTSTTAATITTTTETPTTKFVTNSSTQTTKYNTTTTKKNVTTTTKKLTTTTTKKTTTTTKKATTTTTKKPTSSGGGGSTVLTSKCYNTANGSTLDNSNKKVILNEIA
ncbi:MAG TPA: hypothetical protein P5052_03890 [Candidatus Paceibacterota bacterium]|nr:hypothetical protein [Candidatus Paceibacterota bacterium]HRZ29854.1 hypothetical protein [Candidatus Paceibacterota bacterium]